MGVGTTNPEHTIPVNPDGTPWNSQAPPCPICGASGVQHLFVKNGYPVYGCRQCQVEFLHPQPDDRVLASIYGKDYFLGESTQASRERTANLKSATACLYLDQIAVPLSFPGARILEVGCGSGDFLLQARARGFDVEGIEYSTHAVEQANRKLGTGTVQAGTLETSSVPSEHFHAVVACDVVEHVRDPRGFLRKAHACLRPGGLIFLVTPSLDSWSRSWMGHHWMEYKLEHLFYFGRRSLRILLLSTGFTGPTFLNNEKVVSFEYVYHHFRTYSVPVMTSLIAGARRLLPGRALHYPWRIAGSGVIVMAYKSLSSQPNNELRSE